MEDYIMHNILIHGLGQNSSSWNKTISYMTEQDNIICLELSLFIKDKKCIILRII